MALELNKPDVNTGIQNSQGTQESDPLLGAADSENVVSKLLGAATGDEVIPSSPDHTVGQDDEPIYEPVSEGEVRFRPAKGQSISYATRDSKAITLPYTTTDPDLIKELRELAEHWKRVGGEVILIDEYEAPQL